MSGPTGERTSIGESASGATTAEDGLSRRAFLRGNVAREPRALGWRACEAAPSRPRDVFWACWANDAARVVAGDDGVVLHGDGEGWRRLQTPTRAPIHALWGREADALWAVGWMGGVYAFDGADWTHLRGCETGDDGKYRPVAANTPLFALTGHADGRLWAVGDDGVVLSRTDADWRRETSGVSAHLRAVAAAPSGRVVYAAGAGGALLRREPDGAWRALDFGVASNIQAIMVLDEDDLLLAGGRYFIDANGFRGELIRWRAGRTETVQGDAPFSRFRALVSQGDDPRRDGVLCVGDRGQMHLWREGRATRLPSAAAHDLFAAARAPSGQAWAVGDFATILRADAASGAESAAAPEQAPAIQTAPAPIWERAPSGVDRQLWGVWTDPASGAVYVCGEEGIVLRQEAGARVWEALPPVDASDGGPAGSGSAGSGSAGSGRGGRLGLRALGRADDGGLLAAGQLGEIHHFDGARWRKQFDLHMDLTLLALWSDGRGQSFAVGDEGLILQGSDGAWSRMPSGVKSALYDLWGVDAEHLLAVGDFGLINRWNGRRWDAFDVGAEPFLFGVWGRALDDVFVVGLSGVIGHFDGRRWTVTPARARSDLLAVSGDATRVCAVGAAGAALTFDGRAWRREETGVAIGLRAVSVGAAGTYAVGDGGAILRRCDAP